VNWTMIALSVHVLIAVLGVGVIGALPIVARAARRGGLTPQAIATWAFPLIFSARLSLLLAFVSGAALDFAFGGAFHRAPWFRLAGVLVILTAICLARARAALARATSGSVAQAVALRRIEYWGFTSVAAVACIVVLMEWKPF